MPYQAIVEECGLVGVIRIADAMVATLEDDGFAVTIDRRDLPYGEEWQAELSDFMRRCDSVVWLVSPASVASQWCLWELGEVQRLGKRLVPVRIVDVGYDALPASLGKINVLPGAEVFETSRHRQFLVDTLNTDRTWVKEAGRIAGLAHDWSSKAQERTLLMRGAALRDAEAWVTRQPKTAPPPPPGTLAYLAASRRAATVRGRLWSAGTATIAVVASGLALYAWQQKDTAERQSVIAEERRHLAEAATAQAKRAEDEAGRTARDAQLAQSKFLTTAGTADFTKPGPLTPGTAVLRLLEALPDPTPDDAGQKQRPVYRPAELALERAMRHPRETHILPMPVEVTGLAALADGRLAVGGADGSIRLVGLASTNAAGSTLLRAGLPVGSWASVSAFHKLRNGGLVARSYGDLYAYDLVKGEQAIPAFATNLKDGLAPLELPDGRLAAVDQSGAIVILSPDRSSPARKFPVPVGDSENIRHLVALPDGRLLSASWKSVRLWTVDTGASTLLPDHQGGASQLVAHKDGRVAIVSAERKSVDIWSAATAKLEPLKGELEGIRGLAFSADDRLAVAHGDKLTVFDLATARDNGTSPSISFSRPPTVPAARRYSAGRSGCGAGRV